ncbi:hypothetical protein ES706_01202 [subsurface metagenome]|nr:hypothetical protein [Hadesarchaea archaeon]
MDEKQLKELTNRLDKLIHIVAISSLKDLTTTEKIILLDKSGFAPKEIAEIIGTKPNVVRVRLSEIRKRR